MGATPADTGLGLLRSVEGSGSEPWLRAACLSALLESSEGLIIMTPAWNQDLVCIPLCQGPSVIILDIPVESAHLSVKSWLVMANFMGLQECEPAVKRANVAALYVPSS